MKRTFLVTAVLAAASALSCATMNASGELKYGTNAEKDYQLGLEALDSHRYEDAAKYFDHVRYKYPYSAQAALADLAVGDTHMREEKYAEAIEAYRNFLKLHPNHPKADYAQFSIAKANYEDMPSDFFLFPPSREKDQVSIRDARTSLDEFLKLYPKSSLVPDAQKMVVEVRRRLASHEMYVADFYIHREKWQAAVGRLNRIVTDFPDTSLMGEALLKLGRTYLSLGEKTKAKEALEKLVQTRPNDPLKAEAQKLLKPLG